MLQRQHGRHVAVSTAPSLLHVVGEAWGGRFPFPCFSSNQPFLNRPPWTMSKPAGVVLLIDDEPKIRRFLRAGFKLKEYVVLEAANAADALKILTSIRQTSSFST